MNMMASGNRWEYSGSQASSPLASTGRGDDDDDDRGLFLITCLLPYTEGQQPT